jgi:sugar/nucleoside kinase (ribokinase family)
MNTKSSSARKGILAGGNWIIDLVKLVDVYPQREQLANIRSQHQGTGGSPYNILVDLARMGAGFPLAGAGHVGKDDLGAGILADCKKQKIDTKFLRPVPDTSTSYTDVMTEEGNGRRTFFHYRGANALWNGSDIEFSKSKAKIFHLGYLLLLDALDAPDAKFGTKATRLLTAAQTAGMKTSIDVVSEDSDRFTKVVLPALKAVDYCILNEIEAGKVTGFKLRGADGKLDTVSVRHAAGAMLQQGVRELVVIHFPEGAFCRTRKGEDVWQSSLKLAAKHIAGTAGAGDAFCAGVLLGLHDDKPLQECLEIGVCAAAASLCDPTCTGGMKKLPEVLALKKKFGVRPALNKED